MVKLMAAALAVLALARVSWLLVAAVGELQGSPASPANSSVVARGLVTRRATAASILEEHNRYFHNTSLKMTNGTAIAILTGHRSWRESYRLASRNALKFTHVAPRWFDVSPDGASVDAAESWPVRAMFSWFLRKPSARVLTPLFSFRHLDFKRALPADNSTHGRLAEQLAHHIARRCERSLGCDGALIDVHIAMHARGSTACGFASALVRALSLRLRAGRRQRELLLAVPAYSDAFGKEDVAELDPFVDKIIVQAYGFSSAKRPGPDAPLAWMMHALQGLVPSSDPASARKFVAGMRLGGSDFKESKGGARLCNRTRYLELLRAHGPRIDWYAEANEHVFAYADQANVSHSVYHPTLKSLHDRLSAIRSWGVGVAIDELYCGLDYFFDLL